MGKPKGVVCSMVCLRTVRRPRFICVVPSFHKVLYLLEPKAKPIFDQRMRKDAQIEGFFLDRRFLQRPLKCFAQSDRVLASLADW